MKARGVWGLPGAPRREAFVYDVVSIVAGRVSQTRCAHSSQAVAERIPAMSGLSVGKPVHS